MIDITTISPETKASSNWPPKPYTLGSQRLDFAQRRYIVGVVNLSMDSQYPESVAASAEQAILKARALHLAGADIVEFGAESTGYHAARRSNEQQLELLRPVVERCVTDGVPVGVESATAEVFDGVASCGACWFNLSSY